MMGVLFGALVLTSCGSDDEPKGGDGSSIVGAWETDFPADEIDEYAHLLTYKFNSDRTFELTAANMVKSSMKFGFRFAGSYSTENGKLTLTFKKYWEYESDRNGSERDRWWTGDNKDGSADFSEWPYDRIQNPLVFGYSIDGNTLTLAHGEPFIVEAYGPIILTGTLTRK